MGGKCAEPAPYTFDTCVKKYTDEPRAPARINELSVPYLIWVMRLSNRLISITAIVAAAIIKMAESE